MSAVEITIASLLNQDSKVDEIIIIDSSTDGSGNLCRKFLKYDNVSLIKIAKYVTKYEAWNIGLQKSFGEYVLFFDGNEFLLENAFKNFLWEDHLYFF